MAATPAVDSTVATPVVVAMVEWLRVAAAIRAAIPVVVLAMTQVVAAAVGYCPSCSTVVAVVAVANCSIADAAVATPVATPVAVAIRVAADTSAPVAAAIQVAADTSAPVAAAIQVATLATADVAVILATWDVIHLAVATQVVACSKVVCLANFAACSIVTTDVDVDTTWVAVAILAAQQVAILVAQQVAILVAQWAAILDVRVVVQRSTAM